MKFLSAVLLMGLFVGVHVEKASAHYLYFGTGVDSEPLYLDIKLDDKSPNEMWGDFLRRCFDHFDQDGDGALSEKEASRVFTLPLAAQRTVSFRFSDADANRDSKISREEWKNYYQPLGFTPVVFLVEPPSSTDVQAAKTIFGQLDQDKDGRLSLAELADASQLLRRLDENEDEALTLAEVLHAAQHLEKQEPQTSHVKAVFSSRIVLTHGILRANLANKTHPLRLTMMGGKRIVALEENSRRGAPSARLQLKIADSFCNVTTDVESKQKSIQVARSFYTAQMKEALGGKAAIEKTTLEQEVGYQALAALFDPADRDQNGKLTLAEYTALLDLIEQGVLCQTVVTVRCHGRNLFYRLDANQDGCLDLRELNAAAKRVAKNGEATALTESTIPYDSDIVFERGTPGNAFGPFAFGGPKKKTSPMIASPPTGTRWFDRLDRNQDGSLSPREFLGSPELFRKLDRNADGLIGADETRQADPAAAESK